MTQWKKLKLSQLGWFIPMYITDLCHGTSILFLFNTNPRNQTEGGRENSLVPFHALRVGTVILLAYTVNLTKMAAA